MSISLSDALAADEGVKKAKATKKVASKKKFKSEIIREEQMPLTFYTDKLAKVQLKIMSAEQGKTQGGLMIEAMNLLFEKYGKSRIAK